MENLLYIDLCFLLSFSRHLTSEFVSGIICFLCLFILSEEFVDASDIIERANANITTRLVDGDIAPNLRRNADPCTATGCKWPKYGRYVYIPIIFSNRYTTTERNIIIRALLIFHASTCIRFVRRGSHRNYLYFYSGSGCWSYLGRQHRGQLVSLQKNGWLYKSTVQHEVPHALFLLRESNFMKKQTNNLGTPYDFDSIMHYGKYAFSKNSQPTILAKSNPSLNFGTAGTMSKNDIARVNKLYRC
ncbi:hatching enzyme 1.2-like [Eleginops maclovinus]|uniref:hatching enzyme 1.2-like n=1 Tax=Eleginops maclovinus TaxID=56733 RepID=UPI003080BED5